MIQGTYLKIMETGDRGSSFCPAIDENFAILDGHSHNGMSSGLYTVPTAGKYQVNVGLALGGTMVLNSTSILEIQKKSTTITNVTKYSGGAVTNETIQVSDIISCIAGDVLRIQVSSTGTAPSIIASNTKNFVSISKLGL